MTTIRIPREEFHRAEEMLGRCVRRLMESKAPESRRLGEEAEEQLLDFAAARARFDKMVELYGGEGERPAVVGAEGEPG
jgi:arsenate reductase-like glutaredoxin family protein